MPSSSVSRKLQQYARQNWAPASYRHLHPELKQLIRATRFRPGIKQCYANCQRILLAAHSTALAPRLTYHEGWVRCMGLPVEHAWLTLDRAVQDPTLDTALTKQYLASHRYTVEQVLESAVTTGHWMPINRKALLALMFSSDGFNFI